MHCLLQTSLGYPKYYIVHDHKSQSQSQHIYADYSYIKAKIFKYMTCSLVGTNIILYIYTLFHTQFSITCNISESIGFIMMCAFWEVNILKSSKFS